ncbi:maleylacetoacetate isomerase [Sphingomonas sp. ID0503]|uniref:maleylacetoacetate isomerase n=1 Tax=Sphingomonas sp. ID0503 TaxID=3399691 RepID=UPI003AFB7EEA
MAITLLGYWRSSAAYRVRIALAVKGLSFDSIAINLLEGEQRGAAYRGLNPQGLVPFLRDDPAALSQSLAIIEYLDETYPDPPLLPGTSAERAHARALAQTIASDIHPLNNLRVLKYLKRELGQDQAAIDAWSQNWITEGFTALEAAAGTFLAGDRLTIADICLVPQMYNARRIATDLTPFPKLVALDERLCARPAFAAASPEAQPDAPTE